MRLAVRIFLAIWMASSIESVASSCLCNANSLLWT